MLESMLALPLGSAAAVMAFLLLYRFTPLNGKSVWDGHLRAFLRPLILEAGKPDLTSDSFLWDAGESIRDNQAPTQVQADV